MAYDDHVEQQHDAEEDEAIGEGQARHRVLRLGYAGDERRVAEQRPLEEDLEHLCGVRARVRARV